MYIQIKQKMYQSTPYTAQIPAGTSFLDRRNLPYSLVGLFSCCETKLIILKGKETIQLQIDWFWRVFLSERLPRIENDITSDKTPHTTKGRFYQI